MINLWPIIRGRLVIGEKVRSPVEDGRFVLGRPKNGQQFPAGQVRIKILAGKNVNEGMAFLRKGVDGNVRFDYQDYPRDPRILRLIPLIFENVRGHNLGQADLGREIIQRVEQEVNICQFFLGQP